MPHAPEAPCTHARTHCACKSAGEGVGWGGGHHLRELLLHRRARQRRQRLLGGRRHPGQPAQPRVPRQRLRGKIVSRPDAHVWRWHGHRGSVIGLRGAHVRSWTTTPTGARAFSSLSKSRKRRCTIRGGRPGPSRTTSGYSTWRTPRAPVGSWMLGTCAGIVSRPGRTWTSGSCVEAARPPRGRHWPEESAEELG